MATGNVSAQNAAALAELNSKVDSLADSVAKLAEVVAEDRRNSVQTVRGIYDEMTGLRERATNAGRITWPLIISTLSAMGGFAAIVSGLGSYALRSESSILAAKIDGAEVAFEQRANANAARNETHDAEIRELRENLNAERVNTAAAKARHDTLLELMREGKKLSP